MYIYIYIYHEYYICNIFNKTTRVNTFETCCNCQIQSTKYISAHPSALRYPQCGSTFDPKKDPAAVQSVLDTS